MTLTTENLREANRLRMLLLKNNGEKVTVDDLCKPSSTTKAILMKAMAQGGDLADSAETMWDILFPGVACKNRSPKSKEKSEKPARGLFGWFSGNRDSGDDDDDDEIDYRGGAR